MGRIHHKTLELPKTLFLLPLTVCSDDLDHLLSEHIQALRRLYRPLQFWYDTPEGMHTPYAFPSACYNARTTGVDVYALEREVERRKAPATPEACVQLLVEAFKQGSLLYVIARPFEIQRKIQALLTHHRITPQIYSLQQSSQMPCSPMREGL